jgi:hypothetical protein
MPNETRVHETFTNNPVIQKWITKMSLSLYVSPQLKAKLQLDFIVIFYYLSISILSYVLISKLMPVFVEVTYYTSYPITPIYIPYVPQ